MSLTPEQKRAVLKSVNISDAEQVFNSVSAAIAVSANTQHHPAAWARPDELDRLTDPNIQGRACFLSKEKKERCTVPLYPDKPNSQSSVSAKELFLDALRNALAGVRQAASLLEDVQFRGGMEAACDEIETRLSLTAPITARKEEEKE